MGAPVSPPLSELVGLPLLLLLLPLDDGGISFIPAATAVLLFSASIDDVGNEDEGKAGDNDDDGD